MTSPHGVDEGAFIDDRALSANSTEELVKAVHEIIEMDKRMGRTTNVDKSKLLATGQHEKKCMQGIEINGVKLKTVRSYTLLGLKAVAGNKYDREKPTLAARAAPKALEPGAEHVADEHRQLKRQLARRPMRPPTGSRQNLRNQRHRPRARPAGPTWPAGGDGGRPCLDGPGRPGTPPSS